MLLNASYCEETDVRIDSTENISINFYILSGDDNTDPMQEEN
jgi:hypothetical protein